MLLFAVALILIAWATQNHPALGLCHEHQYHQYQYSNSVKNIEISGIARTAGSFSCMRNIFKIVHGHVTNMCGIISVFYK